jgi:hypothetical protein
MLCPVSRRDQPSTGRYGTGPSPRLVLSRAHPLSGDEVRKATGRRTSGYTLRLVGERKRPATSAQRRDLGLRGLTLEPRYRLGERSSTLKCTERRTESKPQLSLSPGHIHESWPTGCDPRSTQSERADPHNVSSYICNRGCQ